MASHGIAWHRIGIYGINLLGIASMASHPWHRIGIYGINLLGIASIASASHPWHRHPWHRIGIYGINLPPWASNADDVGTRG
ncbi:MAG: hypothetical protein ACO331_10785 [Prochlorothrix sp.]